MGFDHVSGLFRRRLGPNWEKSKPIPVNGMEVVRLIWPLLDIFKPGYEKLKAIPYRPRFETEADAAVVTLIGAAPEEMWLQISPGARRVLLERIMQLVLVLVGVANVTSGTPVTALPSGLAERDQTLAVALLLLPAMRLPWPPADRTRYGFPVQPVPGSVVQHREPVRAPARPRSSSSRRTSGQRRRGGPP